MTEPRDRSFSRPNCPACGNAVPFFARWNISIFRPAYCRSCSNAVTFGRGALVAQLMLYLALLPVFYLVFDRNSWVGYLGLAVILVVSALIANASKLRPVTDNLRPVNEGGKVNRPSIMRVLLVILCLAAPASILAAIVVASLRDHLEAIHPLVFLIALIGAMYCAFWLVARGVIGELRSFARERSRCD